MSRSSSSPVVDLHSHTHRSDGTLSPADLVAAAASRGLDVLALTDHDTTEGVDEALAAARGTRVRLLAGIEISSYIDGRDIHILGIGIDHRSAKLQRKLESMRKSRVERIRKICAKLAALGVEIEPEEVFALAKGKSVGRNHVARVMVRKGYVKDVAAAFRTFLAHGGPAHVKANELTPREAISLVRDAGGVPILAHPGLIGNDDLIPGIAAAGLMGLEVYHKYTRPSWCDKYLDLARRLDLLVSGGSDYHGDETRTEALLGDFTCPPEEWRRISAALRG